MRVFQLSGSDYVLVEPQLGTGTVSNGMKGSVVGDNGHEGAVTTIVPSRTRAFALRVDEHDGHFIRSSNNGTRNNR